MPSHNRRSPGASPPPRRPIRPPRRARRGPRVPGILFFLCGILVGAALLRAGCGNPFATRPAVERAAGEASSPAPSGSAGGRREAAGRDGSKKTHRSGRSSRMLESSAAPRSAETAGTMPGPGQQRPPGEARIALVIDDLGRSVGDLDTLERLGVPITYAVLPYETETPAVVAELQRKGEEILCHLPMEPSGSGDPGPGALWYGMKGDELRRSTEDALAAVPGAVGVNNHMGSRLSADEPSMRAILGVLAEHRLFFLDSRTSAESVGYRLARDLGLPAAERQVFLDTDASPASIHHQFERLLGLAREKGEAIAIGHPHPATLEALAAEVPRAKEQGFRFVLVSDLLAR